MLTGAIAAFALSFLATSASAAPPTIANTQISAPTTTSVTLQAEIDPQGKATEYHFEYGSADCAANPCTALPDAKLPAKASGSGDLTIGSPIVSSLITKAGTFTVGQAIEGPGIPANTKIISRTVTELTLSNAATATTPAAPLSAAGPQLVSQLLSGLTPATTYHFRAVAASKVTVGGGTTAGPDRIFATYAQPQIFEPCPNDLFRTENPAAARIEHSSANLPDCRAYEMATPVDKDGADVTGTVPYSRAAANGGGITFLSSSGLPGGRGSQELPVYLGSREGGEWSTEGLLPPGNTGQRALVLGWTPDFEEVFARAIKVGTPPMTELLMTPKGGEPIKIVDYTASLDPKLAGASEGAAEVLFESKQALPGVPGAQQGRSNLYLWQRSSEEISLAGVLNDETAPSSGVLAGPYDWVLGTNPVAVSKGGADREYYTQEQHAISTDGSAVYFTAVGSGQLYLRKNPTQAQSALDSDGNCTEPELACTIRVSTSQKTNGIGPDGVDSGGPRPAAFMGASADGSVSFFTSSEMLTNDANAGPEQEPAAIELADIADGGNVNSSCLPVHALGIALDAEHIYWADPTSSTIGRASLDCDEVEGGFIQVPKLETEAGALVPSKPQYVAVDAEHIYWTNPPEGEQVNQFPASAGGAIGRADIDGKAESVDAEFITEDATSKEGLSAPQGIAVDAAHIYWANPQQGDKSIGRAGIDGGNADLHFIELGISDTPQGGVAVDASHIYWTVRTNGGADEVVLRDLDGSLASEKFTDSGDGSDPRGIALDAGHIYWARRGSSTIARANLDFGEEQLEWITGADHPFGVAVNAEHVYWSSNGEAPSNPGNALYRYDANTESLSDLAPDSASENGLEARGVLGASEDASRIYFAANGVPDGVVNSPNARGETAEPGGCSTEANSSTDGSCNLYLWQGGQTSGNGTTSFIARLAAHGGEVKTDAANWVATTEAIFQDPNFEKTSRVTPDGRTLLFRSQRQLTAYDNEGVAQFYRYRAGDAGVSCVSCNPTGAPPSPTGRPGFGSVSPAQVTPTNPSPVLPNNLSADGDRVFFETTDALVSSDINGVAQCPDSVPGRPSPPSCTDVYEWEAQGTGTCDAAHALPNGGCYYLISTGKGTEPALISDASADGSEVYFYTRSQLVGSDEDQLLDVYGAHVDGGLPEQNQPPPPPRCEAEACKHGASPVPLVESPPSYFGPTGPQPKRRHCKKHKKLVKGHCAPKRHKSRNHRQPNRKPGGSK